MRFLQRCFWSVIILAGLSFLPPHLRNRIGELLLSAYRQQQAADDVERAAIRAWERHGRP